MAKYIIKNCPSLNQARNLCNEIISICYADYNMGREVVLCKDCTDCLLKRIVEKAKNASPYNFLTEDILRMLEIEECEE